MSNECIPCLHHKVHSGLVLAASSVLDSTSGSPLEETVLHLIAEHSFWYDQCLYFEPNTTLVNKTPPKNLSIFSVRIFLVHTVEVCLSEFSIKIKMNYKITI